MKKALFSLSVMLCFIVSFASAQDFVTNKWPQTASLPEPHDWSIGFDVIPLITAGGNLFHPQSGNDTSFSQQQFTLVGLYMKDNKTAYRLIFRFGVNSHTWDNLVTDDANTTTQLTDTKTETRMNVTIGGGIQKYINSGRLRGFYGWEAGVMLGSHDQKFSYGNPMLETGATSTNFSVPSDTAGFASALASSRPTEIKDGFMFGFSLNGFIGVEYFFAPKMSLSAEYAWGLAYNTTGEATTTTESWTGGNGGNETLTPTSIGKSSVFNLDVQNAMSLIFHLYF